MKPTPIDLDRYIDRLREGSISKDEFAELEQALLGSEELRREFRSRMRLEANLHDALQMEVVEFPQINEAFAGSGERNRVRLWPTWVAIGAAAALAMAFLITALQGVRKEADLVARVVSSQDAVWEHSVDVEQGIGTGELRLLEGLATLRFKSGALVDLEAPASLELIHPMRCRLGDGKAVFEVPESAQGFVVETPDGYAVDHGTQFAVTVSSNDGHAEFGVMDGSISVFHDAAKHSKTLFRGDLVSLTRQGIRDVSASAIKRNSQEKVVSFRTNGREDSIIRDNQREEFLDPSLLMVKRDLPGWRSDKDLPDDVIPKDRRALFGYKIGAVDLDRIESVSLKLNLVPSGSGYAKFTPEQTNFQVYGVRDDQQLESWQVEGLLWENAPGSAGRNLAIDESQLVLLGEFVVPRSMVEGQVVFESPELDRFVRADKTGFVDFVIATDTAPQRLWSRVHAFASSLHTSASCPTLELRIKADTSGN